MRTVEEVAREIAADPTTHAGEVAANDQLDAAVRRYDLADAICDGSKHSDQAYGWGNGENLCALSAARAATEAAKLS